MAAPLTTPTLDVEAVYTAHVSAVWRFLRSMGVREGDLEDVCQEVFVVVHRQLASFDGRHPITTWLYAICFRAASSYRRKASFRREVVTDALPDAGQDASQTDAVARAQARRLLARVLEELDDDKRAVFVLYEIEEQPMSEVAAALGCPLQTAYSRLHAARAHVEAATRRLRLRGER
ncbi:MAG: sigma-70 family RNA polymerase sigma factor [Polyangiales bacterium]